MINGVVHLGAGFGDEGDLPVAETHGFDSIEIWGDGHHSHEVVYDLGLAAAEALDGGNLGRRFGMIFDRFGQTIVEMARDIFDPDDAAVSPVPRGIVAASVGKPQNGGGEDV